MPLRLREVDQVIVEIGFMSDVNNSSRVSAYPAPSVSFGLHRHCDHPASALRSGVSTMPPAWQTRAGPSGIPQRSDSPARSFGDIALDPWRYVTATGPRTIAFGGLAASVALIWVF